MVTESMMYWITRLDGIHNSAMALLAASVFIIIIAAVIFVSAASESAADFEDVKDMWASKFMKSSRRWLLSILISAILVQVFVPTTKEMAMIYAVPAITRSDLVREDLPELYDYGIDALKEQLKEWSEPKDSNNG